MNGIYLIAVVSAITIAGVSGRDSPVQLGENPIDWYDCTGKIDGNYPHPSDCHKYIFCGDEVAFVRECPPCRVDAVSCPDGQLVYNFDQDVCDFADRTPCNPF